MDIASKIRSWTVDWNGAPMVDGEPPRDGLHCRDLRDAADEIERLRYELEKQYDHNAMLDTDIEWLRTALKPFAEVAREWDGEPESLEVELRAYDDKMCPGVSVADFRRAAEALRDEQSEKP